MAIRNSGISVYILIVVDYVRDNLGSITAVTDSAGHVFNFFISTGL